MDREFEEYENAIIAQSVSAEAASYAWYLARACKEPCPGQRSVWNGPDVDAAVAPWSVLLSAASPLGAHCMVRLRGTCIALRGGVNTPSFLERMLESAGCCGDLRRTRASVRVSPWRELDVVGLFSLWARVKRQRDLLEALGRAGGVVAGGFALQRLLLISEGAALGAGRSVERLGKRVDLDVYVSGGEAFLQVLRIAQSWLSAPERRRRGPPRSATATSAVAGGSTAAADLPFAAVSNADEEHFPFSVGEQVARPPPDCFPRAAAELALRQVPLPPFHAAWDGAAWANHYRTPSHAHSVLLAALHALPEQLSGSDASAAVCRVARLTGPRHRAAHPFVHGITVDGDALPDGNDYPIAGWSEVRNINIVELAPSVPAAAAVRGFDMEPLKVTMFIDAAGRFAFDASELTRACARRREIVLSPAPLKPVRFANRALAKLAAMELPPPPFDEMRHQRLQRIAPALHGVVADLVQRVRRFEAAGFKLVVAAPATS